MDLSQKQHISQFFDALAFQLEIQESDSAFQLDAVLFHLHGQVKTLTRALMERAATRMEALVFGLDPRAPFYASCVRYKAAPSWCSLGCSTRCELVMVAHSTRNFYVKVHFALAPPLARTTAQ